MTTGTFVRQSSRLAFLVLLVGVVLVWVWRAALTREEAAKVVETPPVIDWDKVVDDPREKLTITWMPLPQFPRAVEGALGERLVEKRFNIEIQPIFLDEMSYSRRKPLMFATGDVPDMTWDGGPGDVQRDIFHGCLVPVPREVIQKYAPTYFRTITQYAPMGWVYANSNGMNWGLPTCWIDGGRVPPGAWRKDWLRAVGIEKEPQTLEEFHEAMRRFTFNDPDGNGRKDTYGMTNTTIAWHEMFREFFGAYGSLPFGWVERQGTIVWGGVAPETQHALKLLADWYREGIIDPEMVTDGMGGNRRMREKFMNGRVGYGYGLGTFGEFDRTGSESLVNVMQRINPKAEAVPAAFPIGPDGLRGARNWGTAANIMVAGPGIARKPAKMIRILRMLEYLAGGDTDAYMLNSRGKQGVHWDYRLPDQQKPGTGPSSGIRSLPPYDDPATYQREVLLIWGAPNPEIDQKYRALDERNFTEKVSRKEWAMEDALGRPDLIPSARLYFADLRNWQLTVFEEIIRGEKPVEYFETFCEEWSRRGGAIMTSEAAELLKEKKRIYAELGIHSTP